MRGLVLLCALSLSACGDSETARLSTRNDQKILAAKDLVKAKLRDPESAIFSEVTISPLSAVCGFVNSRNGFGGMGGRSRFIVVKSAYLEAQFDADNGMFERLWKDSCDSTIDEFIHSIRSPEASQ